MKKFKVSIFGIFLFLLAAGLLTCAVLFANELVKSLDEAKASGVDLAPYAMNILNDFMQSSIIYVIYAVALAALGWLIQKQKLMALAAVPAPVQPNVVEAPPELIETQGEWQIDPEPAVLPDELNANEDKFDR
ncbi:MAG: hypothetical protein LBH86_03645 [Oscillospiraceae bacterium]|jgi:hypothetical protein|nr:hypothetical protein [Oscillospiraceae bacterium]